MTDQLKEIGTRLSALREIMELSCGEMAEKTGVTTEEYTAYEKGEKDFSFSFLYNAAGVLGVDVLDIISGETPKLSAYCIVRNGQGYDINRRKAYAYKHLAFTFRNKKAEPFRVTVEPNDTTPVLHSHESQEFVYMLSGSMNLYIGETVNVLNQGDSIYFNAEIPHAMKALENAPAQFLSVVV